MEPQYPRRSARIMKKCSVDKEVSQDVNNASCSLTVFRPSRPYSDIEGNPKTLRQTARNETLGPDDEELAKDFRKKSNRRKKSSGLKRYVAEKLNNVEAMPLSPLRDKTNYLIIESNTVDSIATPQSKIRSNRKKHAHYQSDMLNLEAKENVEDSGVQIDAFSSEALTFQEMEENNLNLVDVNEGGRKSSFENLNLTFDLQNERDANKFCKENKRYTQKFDKENKIGLCVLDKVEFSRQTDESDMPGKSPTNKNELIQNRRDTYELEKEEPPGRQTPVVDASDEIDVPGKSPTNKNELIQNRRDTYELEKEEPPRRQTHIVDASDEIDVPGKSPTNKNELIQNRRDTYELEKEEPPRRQTPVVDASDEMDVPGKSQTNKNELIQNRRGTYELEKEEPPSRQTHIVDASDEIDVPGKSPTNKNELIQNRRDTYELEKEEPSSRQTHVVDASERKLTYEKNELQKSVAQFCMENQASHPENAKSFELEEITLSKTDELIDYFANITHRKKYTVKRSSTEDRISTSSPPWNIETVTTELNLSKTNDMKLAQCQSEDEDLTEQFTAQRIFAARTTPGNSRTSRSANLLGCIQTYGPSRISKAKRLSGVKQLKTTRLSGSKTQDFLKAVYPTAENTTDVMSAASFNSAIKIDKTYRVVSPPSGTSTPFPSTSMTQKTALVKDRHNVTFNSISSSAKRTKLSRVKVPNFARIHQKQLDRMESIGDYKERRAERAKLLLSGHKPTSFAELSSRKKLPQIRGEPSKTTSTIKCSKALTKVFSLDIPSKYDAQDFNEDRPEKLLFSHGISSKGNGELSVNKTTSAKLMHKAPINIKTPVKFFNNPIQRQTNVVPKFHTPKAGCSLQSPKINAVEPGHKVKQIAGTSEMKTPFIPSKFFDNPELEQNIDVPKVDIRVPSCSQETAPRLCTKKTRNAVAIISGSPKVKVGYTRFGFKLPIKVTKDEIKCVLTKSAIVKNKVEERRTYLKGVRLNRRFELLMNMRNK